MYSYKVNGGVSVEQYSKETDGYLITGTGGFQLKCDLLIVANGAHSSFTKEIAKIRMEPKYYAAGLRAYYKNVTGTNADNFIELHFIKKMLPGYFWIFSSSQWGGQCRSGYAE